MEANYANLIKKAQRVRRTLSALGQETEAKVLGEVIDALFTVCTQNRNLRHNLKLTGRDLDAATAELLKYARGEAEGGEAE